MSGILWRYGQKTEAQIVIPIVGRIVVNVRKPAIVRIATVEPVTASIVFVHLDQGYFDPPTADGRTCIKCVRSGLSYYCPHQTKTSRVSFWGEPMS